MSLFGTLGINGLKGMNALSAEKSLSKVFQLSPEKVSPLKGKNLLVRPILEGDNVQIPVESNAFA